MRRIAEFESTPTPMMERFLAPYITVASLDWSRSAEGTAASEDDCAALSGHLANSLRKPLVEG